MSKPRTKRPAAGQPQAAPAAKIRTVVVLSDIHTGSTVALMPPGFTTLEGVVLEPNPIQQWLWDCWQDMQQWLDGVVGADPWALVLNGDLTEGVHHGTKQIISTDTGDHVEAAIHLLRPLAHKATRTFVVKGTECHTGNNEIVIGKALKLEVNSETGLPAWDRLTMDVAGVRCVFRHHIGTSVRRSLAATQFSVNLAEEQVEAVNNGEPVPRVLCCAHRHKYGKYEDDRGVCVVSPPWQMLSRFAHKVVSQARTKPGVYVLDWRDVPDGELPVIHRRLYDTPHPQAVAL